MPIPAQYSSIIDKLLSASREGRVNWQETTNETEFFVSFNQFSLSIWSYITDDEGPGISVRLLDASGKMIDFFSIDAGRPDYTKLADLLDLARRKARRVDDALSHIAKELETDKAIGDEPLPF